jgi:hypothetical protein
MVEHALLEKISGLLKSKDAQALVELREHADKGVRKAVGKALHTLKSQGVAIPEREGISWKSDGLQALRGQVEPAAAIDTKTTPGLTRFVLADPDPESGGRLHVGAIAANDRVVDFRSYFQTDGQRARLLREWERRLAGRTVPVAWLRARIRWAREQTIRLGFVVPVALDKALMTLGDTPDGRPPSFLGERLADAPGLGSAENVDAILQTLGVPGWPVWVTMDATLEEAAKIHGENPPPTEESARLDLLKRSMANDEALREGLRGPVANAMEDVAAFLWQDGEDGTARAAYDMAQALRSSESPHEVEWIVRIVGYQVASLIRQMGMPVPQANAGAESAQT